MNILKFYAYLFYRFKIYYDKWQAILVFNMVLVFNLLSVLFTYVGIMHLTVEDITHLHYTNNYFHDRFILGTIQMGPLFLTTFLLSRIFKKKLAEYYIEFRDEPLAIKEKRNRGRILYLVGTVLFFIFSLVSQRFYYWFN